MRYFSADRFVAQRTGTHDVEIEVMVRPEALEKLK